MTTVAGLAELQLRYVVVGLGNMGRKRRAILGDRCVATVDPYNTEADYRSLAEVALERYDAAILSVPDADKVALMRVLLASGKHVLVEKPLVCDTLADLSRLREIATAHGAIWYTAYNHRFEPGVQQLKAWIGEGRLGDLYHARMFYGNGTARNVKGSHRDQGTGVAADLISHLYDLSGWLFGGSDWFEHIQCMDRIETNAPDHAVVWRGPVMLEASYLCWRNTFTIDAYGSRGSLHLAGLLKWGNCYARNYVRPASPQNPDAGFVACSGPDTSFRDEMGEFERRVSRGESSFNGDRAFLALLQQYGGTDRAEAY